RWPFAIAVRRRPMRNNSTPHRRPPAARRRGPGDGVFANAFAAVSQLAQPLNSTRSSLRVYTTRHRITRINLCWLSACARWPIQSLTKLINLRQVHGRIKDRLSASGAPSGNRDRNLDYWEPVPVSGWSDSREPIFVPANP